MIPSVEMSMENNNQSMTKASMSSSLCQTQLPSHQAMPLPQLNQQEKPLKMNTYIQLEIDQSNFNCLPRVCKFLVSKLSINEMNGHFSHALHHSHQASVVSYILAVKLQGNKRSFRTIEIPMHRCSSQSTSSSENSKAPLLSSVDLNLSYHITYPHFIKKDTNILYFYIQRKKKYKTKTILGYKTLAYTFVDLSTVLQRPFTDNLPLFFRTNTKTSSKSSHARANVIGSLSLVCLVSQPVDLSLDLEYLAPSGTHCVNNTSDYSDNEIHFEMGKRKKALSKKARLSTASNQAAANLSGNVGGAISDVVGVSGGAMRGQGGLSLSSSKATPNSSSKTRSNSKKFTGKIIQFIRKLKNDNITLTTAGLSHLNGNELMMPISSSATATVDDEDDDDEEDNDDEEDEVVDDDDVEENENEEEDDDDEAVSDLDEFYNIEQISDYNSDSDDPGSKAYEPDTYSIVSTPKPKIQPFFTNTNAFFQYNGSQYNSTDLLKTPKTQSTTTILTTTASKQIEESTLNMSQHLCVFYSDESDPLAVRISRLLAEESTFCSKFIIVSSLADLSRIMLTESNYLNTFKLLIFVNEQTSLQNYVQNIYLEGNVGILNSKTSLKQYVVMRRAVSFLGAQLTKSSSLYQSLFSDEWWSRLDWTANDLGSCIKELAARFIKYITTESIRELSCQVGELMINQMVGDDLSSKFIPFLSDVRIGFGPDVSQIPDDVFSSNTPTHSTRSSLSTSSSTPQFSSLTTSNSQCPSSSPLTLNTQTSNVLSSSFTSSQPSSSSQISSQNPSKPINNQTPKLLQQQTTVPTQSTLPAQPAISFSASSTSPPNSPKTSIGMNIYDEIVYNLQLDYWTSAYSPGNYGLELASSSQSQQSSNQQTALINSNQKITQKAWFKNLHVFRNQLAVQNNCQNSELGQSLTLVYQIKEKKQKIMRLSKKPKENENKKDVVEGLTRLVCTSKNHSTPLNVFVDDIEYNNIKFLQISSLWRGKVTFLNFTIPSNN